MYQTIEAIYDNGRIFPIDDTIHLKKTRVLLTILDKEEVDFKKKVHSKLSMIFSEAKQHKIEESINILKISEEIDNDIF